MNSLSLSIVHVICVGICRYMCTQRSLLYMHYNVMYTCVVYELIRVYQVIADTNKCVYCVKEIYTTRSLSHTPHYMSKLVLRYIAALSNLIVASSSLMFLRILLTPPTMMVVLGGS